MIDCYFCKKPLEQYKDTKVYNYFLCNNCPNVITKPNYFHPIWNSPCVVISNSIKIIQFHLSFEDLGLQLGYYFTDSFFEIRELKTHKIICAFDEMFDILSMPVDVLKRKIQIWVTFS